MANSFPSPGSQPPFLQLSNHANIDCKRPVVHARENRVTGGIDLVRDP